MIVNDACRRAHHDGGGYEAHHFGRDVHVARQNGDDEAGPAIARQVEPGKAGMKAQHFQRARHARHQPADDLRAHDDPFQRQAKMIGKSGV
ncbi:hypothetical protein DO76_1840 [Brucella suis]|nr:hypothetical protein DO76_1840 [Brucella suis]